MGLEVIFVAVSDEVDAFTIFETLNATGKDLTPLDLIKNQVFKLYPKLPHLDEPSDSWKLILSNSEGRNLKFLNVANHLHLKTPGNHHQLYTHKHLGKHSEYLEAQMLCLALAP